MPAINIAQGAGTPLGYHTRKANFLMQPHDTTQPAFIALHPYAIDLAGERFGRLVALGPIGKKRSRNVVWLCRCDCGNTKEIPSSNLRNGVTRSCGCLMKESVKRRFSTHGMSTHPLWGTWWQMIQRCTNSRVSHYANYGGRGISVCAEWQHDFQTFLHGVSQLPHYGEEGYTLDRIDNDGNYEPGNVQWATNTEQARNSRHAHLIEFRGKTQCLTAWSEELGINRGTLNSRIFQGGWSIERAFATPVGRSADA